jgi:hypothetical protein
LMQHGAPMWEAAGFPVPGQCRGAGNP